MVGGAVTVGTSVVEVPTSGRGWYTYGVRVTPRLTNAADVFMGFDPSVTTATGILLGKGDMFTVPSEHFAAGKRVYLVSTAAGQTVDWSAE